MRIKKIIINVFLAAIISFIILSIFSFFYYNIPIHYASKTGATDYVWEKNKYYSRGTEGFSYGKTDANGYNNLTIPNEINILLMGSSQMEGFNVLQKQNTISKLNELLNNKLYAYNIGTSGHTLQICLSNLKSAVKEFSPNKYIIIETQDFMTEEELNNIYNDAVAKIPSQTNGVIAKLQKIDYLRLLYSQYKSYNKSNNENIDLENKKVDMKSYAEKLNVVLEKANKIAEESSCELIIFMDDSLKKNENGIILSRKEDDYYKLYKEACEKNNIMFVDMYEHFVELYRYTYKLPHGFSNTKVGIGHLNEYGHEVIAKVLFDIIKEKEDF